jgi:hypothetical protein
MDSLEAVDSFEKKPNSVLVVALVTGAAALFSWLGCYAIVGVLQANEVISVYSSHNDPRLRWFFQSFSVLLATFSSMALLLHLWTRRQMQYMDVLEHEEAA